MNQQEFKKFFAYITAVTNDSNPSPAKVEVYWDALNDLPFDTAMIAAKRIVATLENPFLPMPATIRGVVAELTGPRIKTHGEAWEEVTKAIRNYGGYREEEALASVSELTARAIKAVGWKSLCYSEEQDIIRAQFRKAYEALAQREEKEAKVPQKLKELAETIGERMIPVKDNARPRLTAEEAEKLYL